MPDIEAISDDIEMASRSAEMARHVALDHGPELIQEIKRLRRAVDALKSVIAHLPDEVEVPSAYVLAAQMALANLQTESRDTPRVASNACELAKRGA